VHPLHDAGHACKTLLERLTHSAILSKSAAREIGGAVEGKVNGLGNPQRIQGQRDMEAPAGGHEPIIFLNRVGIASIGSVGQVVPGCKKGKMAGQIPPAQAQRDLLA
jgi:hypothetical protein